MHDLSHILVNPLIRVLGLCINLRKQTGVYSILL